MFWTFFKSCVYLVQQIWRLVDEDAETQVSVRLTLQKIESIISKVNLTERRL